MNIEENIFVINHGTYPFDILVCIDVPLEKIDEWFEKNSNTVISDDDKEKISMDSAGRTIMLKSNITIMRFRGSDIEKDIHGFVSHEIFHAVEFLFERIGIKYSIDSGEAWAYQIQHLTKQIYKNLLH